MASLPDLLRLDEQDLLEGLDELPRPRSHLGALLVQFAQAPARLRFDIAQALTLMPLGDRRRNERVQTLLTAMMQGHGEHLTATHAASGGQPWPHAMGAFRFYNNDAIPLPALYAGCWMALRTLVPVGRRCFVVHDLSTVDYSHHGAKLDRVPIGDGWGRGYELYSALVLDEAGRPLGPVVQELRTADGVLSSLAPSEALRPRVAVPTYPFTSDYAQIERALSAVPTVLPERERIHLLDAHFDELQLLRTFTAQHESFVIRAFQFARQVTLTNGTTSTLGRACDALALELRGEVERQGKVYDLWTGETKVTFGGTSWRGVKKGKKPQEGAAVELRVVVAELRRAGKTEHRWVLLTQRPEPLDQIVQMYLWRWRVERLFFFTKVGLKLEQWEQQCGARIARRLAVASLAAMASYQLEGLEDAESVEVRKAIATRGGWLGRKRDPIGPLVLMRGMATVVGALSLLEQVGADGVRKLGQRLSRLLGMPLPGIPWPPVV